MMFAKGKKKLTRDNAFNKALSSGEVFIFSLNTLTPCLGQNFASQRGISGGFCPRMKRGCLHHLESSAKYTKVLPQAKCRETSHYFYNPPASSLKGYGETFSKESFPESPVFLVSRLPSFPVVPVCLGVFHAEDILHGGDYEDCGGKDPRSRVSEADRRE